MLKKPSGPTALSLFALVWLVASLVFTIFWSVGASAGSTTPIEVTEHAFLTHLGRDKDTVATRSAALVVPLPNRNEVRFVPVKGPNDQQRGVLIVESIRSGNVPMAKTADLSGADPTTVFHALSPPGTPMPRFLIETASPDGTNTHSRLRAQGWARSGYGLTGGRVYHGGGCSTVSSFRALANHGYGYLFVSHFDGPTTNPSHWFPMDDAYPGLEALTGAINGASSVLHAVVQFCDSDGQPNDNSGADSPRVEFEYRINGGAWSHEVDYLHLEGDIISLWYHPTGIGSPFHDEAEFGDIIDFRLTVDFASDFDTFNIGANWGAVGVGFAPTPLP